MHFPSKASAYQASLRKQPPQGSVHDMRVPRGLTRQQTRGFVDGALFRILEQCPWGPTLAQNYQLQLPGDCVSNAMDMQKRLLDDLHRQGQLEIASRTDNPSRLLVQLKQLFGIEPPELDREYRVNPTVADIVDLIEQHGPGVLVLARLLPADQGGTQYAGHHAVLAICTFEAGGQHWAVALDGNDLQNNPIMIRVRAYADRYRNGELEQITNGDLAAIRMEMKMAGEFGDPGQLVYSLINLDEAVRTADAACRAYRTDLFRNGGYSYLTPINFPNSICVATNATLTGQSMPDEMKYELARHVTSQPRHSTSPLKIEVPFHEL